MNCAARAHILRIVHKFLWFNGSIQIYSRNVPKYGRREQMQIGHSIHFIAHLLRYKWNFFIWWHWIHHSWNPRTFSDVNSLIITVIGYYRHRSLKMKSITLLLSFIFVLMLSRIDLSNRWSSILTSSSCSQSHSSAMILDCSHPCFPVIPLYIVPNMKMGTKKPSRDGWRRLNETPSSQF